MWRQLRAYIRVMSFALFVLIMFLFYLPVRSVLKLFRQPFEPLRNLYMRMVAIAGCFIFNVKVEIRGTPPKPPFFLVCNHISYLDILPMYLALNCTFIAKKEIRSWPVIGYLVDKMGVVFLNRKRRSDVVRVNQIITKAMSKHQGIVVFPEGTSTPGREVLPLRSSLLQYPSSKSMPVHAASIYYKTGPNDAPAVESICFFGGRLSFWKHLIGMARCNSIYCRMEFAPNPVMETNRKELTRKLRSKIESIFTPSSSNEEISLLAKKSAKLTPKPPGKS